MQFVQFIQIKSRRNIMKQNDRIQVTLPEETSEFLKREAEKAGLEPKDIARGILNLAAKKDEEHEDLEN